MGGGGEGKIANERCKEFYIEVFVIFFQENFDFSRLAFSIFFSVHFYW